MSSVNSVRIPGLATGMDTDQMVKDMLVGEQNKVDKANQTQQVSKWKQETYRNTIKSVKGLYDKYFTKVSPDYILGSDSFSTMSFNSSNSNIISATSGAGARNINYKFQVEKMAQPAKLESIKFDKEMVVAAIDTKITINGKAIDIKAGSKARDVLKSINDTFKDGEVKAIYSEMTGKFTLETTKTGQNSEINVTGDIFTTLGMNLGAKGSNNKVTVFDADGVTQLKVIEDENNSFAIDDITYSVNGASKDLISMTSTRDTKGTIDKMKGFISDYNKMVDNIYEQVTQKKNKEYPPLTEAQKKDMSKEEIEKWEEKAKVGILRNDSELRTFMEDVKGAILGSLKGQGISLSEIGITSDPDYNKPGQIEMDEKKFKKALEENGDLVYKTTTGMFEKIMDVTYKYAGHSSSIFVKKAGMENSSTVANNLFSEQIRKQEQYIKDLTIKMNRREQELYSKFAKLESSMNKLNSQMNYMMSEMA